MSVLLSSLMEALLNYVCIQKLSQASLTKAWKRSIERQKRDPKSPKHPYLAELIEVVDEMKLLRSEGLQAKLFKLYLENAKNKWIADEASFHEAVQNASKISDAKGNYDNLHGIERTQKCGTSDDSHWKRYTYRRF